MRPFDDDEDVMSGFWSRGDASAHGDDSATFDAARAVVRAGLPATPPVASPELATLLREGAPRRSRMNPLAKIAGLGLTGKIALVSGVALAASAGGLTVAGVATSGNSHAAAGLGKATTAVTATHGTDPSGDTQALTEPTAAATPTNHGTCVSAVAQSTPDPSASPNAHGQAVAAVAQSDCNKPTGHGKPTALPTQANSHASTHPTGKPTALPTQADSHASTHPTGGSHPTGEPTTLSHPTGEPTSVPPSHPTGAPASHPGS